jgi:glyoxylase-like metal-dependent hydrolase (beta-lactamase superfamily II)
MSDGFVEVGDRVFVLRHPGLDVNVTLIVGTDEALLVDTLSTTGQATALAAAVRQITPNPLVIVNTHHHFDHCFGNAVLGADPPRPIWAHEVTARLLGEEPDRLRQRAYDEMLPTEPALAAELLHTPILAPDRTVHQESTVDLGGRHVLLHHFGRGHTAGDLVVHVPDADLLVAGDLLEEGAPPSFEDSYPLEWPDTVADLLRLGTPRTVVVPGHGAVMGTVEATAQHERLTELAWLIREAHADDAPVAEVVPRAPFGPRAAAVAVHRGYAQLAGDT